MMEKPLLQQQLKAYEQWKADLMRTVSDFRDWLQQHDQATPENVHRLAYCLETLENDRLTIAFVAEFSRGKTELINALFFADYGRRLLPSAAGRTTMCPTEIFYDDKLDQAYVRLLPIETCRQERPLSDYKQHPDEWQHIPLNLDSTQQIEEALAQVAQTKRATLDEARRLGLFDPDLHPDQNVSPTHVDIPKWRHALISFPHPLLKQGLTVLDTPGLNALGYEPELTLNMLPQAQAVLFVLAADTGVTRSDLEMWRHHIKGFMRNRQNGVAVALNKIDALWDELQDEASNRQNVQKQRSSSAQTLGVDETLVFPISAQKGLVAKIRHDEALLQSSALPQLEAFLSQNILSAKQQIMRDTVTEEVCRMVEGARDLVASNLAAFEKQKAELATLSDKSQDVVMHLMQTSREEQTKYLNDIKRFTSDREKLKKQAATLQQVLDIAALDGFIADTRFSMEGSWTTHGLKSGMGTLFGTLCNNMQQAIDQSEHLRKLVRSIYRHFQSEHGFADLQPQMFSLMKYKVELDLLHQEAEVFRKSPAALVTEKHFLIRRFFNALVIQARETFVRAGAETDAWVNSALNPLAHQIRDHKSHMEKRLQDLQKISHSRGTLQSRISELEEQAKAQECQLTTLRNMHNTLSSSQPLTDQARPRPHLVSQKIAS